MQTHVDLNTVYALGLIVIAAIMNGVYTLPMKLNRLWAWEHSWFAFTIVGVVVVPTGLAMFTIPELWSIYFSIPIKLLLALADRKSTRLNSSHITISYAVFCLKK